MIKLTELLKEDRSNVSYGCLMAVICAKDAEKLNAFGNKLVPDEILYKEGDDFGRTSKEEWHSTIKYGFTPDITKEQIEDLIKGIHQFKIKLKGISEFKNDKFDVVKFDVDSDIMEKLNEKASKFPNNDEHPIYHSHATIAYIEPKSKNINKKTDIEVTIDRILYSPIDGEKIYFKLPKPEKRTLTEGERLDYLNSEIIRLEREWDRLDDMGGREMEQREISDKLKKLRKEKSGWDSCYAAAMNELLTEELGGSHDLVYGGVFHDGRVVAFVATATAHNHTREMGRNRWIYDESKKCVYWHEFPIDKEDKPAVENYLHRRGYVVNFHRNMRTYYDPIVNMNENIINEGSKLLVVESFLRDAIKGTEWNHNVYAVGGYVRDLIMGNVPKDMDLVVEKPNGGILFADWLAKKYGIYKEGSNPVIASKFGTAKLRLDGVVYHGTDLTGEDIETVMTRSETYNDPNSRKPDVEYSDLKGDAMRRDLTINALYKKISTGEILDPTGTGLEDIKNKLIRTPISPDLIYKDDALRMFRVIRFANRYGWELTPEVKAGIERNLGHLGNTSKERIRDELDKVLLSNTPDRGIRMLKDVGLLPYVAPELQATVGLGQNKFHSEDVFFHSLSVLSKTKPTIVKRLMSLFHDIGKVETREIIDGEVHFYSHEFCGAETAERILTALKYPTDIIKPVVLGIRNHMRLKQSGAEGEVVSDKALRKFAVDLGEHLEDVLEIMEADNASHISGHKNPNQIPNIRARIDKLRNTIPAKNAKLPVTGEDLKNLGLKQGPLFKELLDLVKDQQLENPNTSKEEYLDLIKAHLSSKS